MSSLATALTSALLLLPYSGRDLGADLDHGILKKCCDENMPFARHQSPEPIAPHNSCFICFFPVYRCRCHFSNTWAFLCGNIPSTHEILMNGTPAVGSSLLPFWDVQAVELKTGPRFGVSSVKNWSKSSVKNWSKFFFAVFSPVL